MPFGSRNANLPHGWQVCEHRFNVLCRNDQSLSALPACFPMATACDLVNIACFMVMTACFLVTMRVLGGDDPWGGSPENRLLACLVVTICVLYGDDPRASR